VEDRFWRTSDNSPLVGPVGALGAAFEMMTREGAARGLDVQPQKSSLHRAPPGARIPPSLAAIPLAPEGITLLGCPVGTAAYRDSWRAQWLAESTAGLSELGELGDPQMALHIIRKCILARPTYWLRLLQPDPEWREHTAGL